MDAVEFVGFQCQAASGVTWRGSRCAWFPCIPDTGCLHYKPVTVCIKVNAPRGMTQPQTTWVIWRTFLAEASVVVVCLSTPSKASSSLTFQQSSWNPEKLQKWPGPCTENSDDALLVLRVLDSGCLFSQQHVWRYNVAAWGPVSFEGFFGSFQDAQLHHNPVQTTD